MQMRTGGKSLERKNSILSRCIWILGFKNQVGRMRNWFENVSGAHAWRCNTSIQSKRIFWTDIQNVNVLKNWVPMPFILLTSLWLKSAKVYFCHTLCLMRVSIRAPFLVVTWTPGFSSRGERMCWIIAIHWLFKAFTWKLPYDSYSDT